MSRARSEIQVADITVVCDTREKLPWDLSPLKVIRGTLATSDYSIAGLESEVAVERKSLADLVMCCGAERERFEREIQRMLAYPQRLLVVEATWGAIEAGGWRGKLQPSHIIGSLIGWQAVGIPVMCVSDHITAGRYVAKYMYIAARRRWRMLQAFKDTLKIAGDEHGKS